MTSNMGGGGGGRWSGVISGVFMIAETKETLWVIMHKSQAKCSGKIKVCLS